MDKRLGDWRIGQNQQRIKKDTFTVRWMISEFATAGISKKLGNSCNFSFLRMCKKSHDKQKLFKEK
jgi:hypothetical protein